MRRVSSSIQIWGDLHFILLTIEHLIDVSKHYSNLEYDIELGQRGNRYAHVEEILCRLSGAESALVVNNNAGAVLLVVNTLADKRYAMAEIGSDDQWEMLDKSTSTTGYPRRWRRFSNRLQVHPVPSASYLTKLLVLGFAKEADLSGSSDTFNIDSMWHPAIIDMAVYLGAKDMGWVEDANEALMACDRAIEECISILGRENACDRDVRSWVVGDPTY